MKQIIETIKSNKIMSILFGGVLGLIILLVIIFGIGGCVQNKNMSYEDLETKLLEASTSYFNDNESELPTTEGAEVSITLESLIEKEYLKPLKKMVKVDCSGNVVVKKNGEHFAMYPTLTCGSEYTTSKLISELTKNVVTSGDGLYLANDEYYFKGEYVNNYVSFSDNIWRILSIKKDGNIRLIKNESETKTYVFDNRYNIEAQKEVGINNFATSRLKETLDSLYTVSKKGFNEKALGHLVAHNVCIKKRNADNIQIDRNEDCSEVYGNQFISIPSISEYYRASNDQNCTTMNRDICTNYNYLSQVYRGIWSSTASTSNTYEVFTTYGSTEQASSRNDINIIIELDAKEIYESGNGSEESPYVIQIK